MFDADQDGDNDLVTLHPNNGNKLWLNDGSGNFTSLGIMFGSLRTLSIGCGDLDGDNDYEIVLGQLEGTGGNSIYFNETMIVGVYEKKGLEPHTYMLHNNYPNPFNPSTTLSYSIPELGMVELIVYDVLGKEIAKLVNKEQQAGSYEVQFDASNLGSGIYFYRIQAGDFVEAKKMVLMK